VTGVNSLGKDTIKIPRKDKVRGDDGYKTFSVRIKEETVAALDDLASRTNRSRNDLINFFLEYAVENSEII
jgi:predicted HicB family RNase H-like nuclease